MITCIYFSSLIIVNDMKRNGATTVVPNTQKKPTWPGMDFINKTVAVIIVQDIVVVNVVYK